MILREDWMHVELMARNDSPIALPDGVSAGHDADVHIVKAIGPDVKNCLIGDEVIMCGINEGGKFQYKGLTYCVVRESNVVCMMNR